MDMCDKYFRPPFGGQGLRELVPSARPTKGSQSRAVQYRACLSLAPQKSNPQISVSYGQ